MAEHKKLSMLVKLDDGQTYTLGGDGADNAVTLDTEQTITGLKTFDKLPQSSVEPKADADLITKGYADGHYQPVDTKPHRYDILVKMKHDGTSWVGFSDFSVRLRDGTRLDVKHIENQDATTATKPVKAVFKTVKDLKASIERPTQQPATFFDSYHLEAGEFTGTVSFYKAVGQFGPAIRDINPWYVYVGNGNANNYDGIYAVSIDNLDKPLLGVNFKFGDVHEGDSYTCLQCGVVFTVDGSALEVAYDGDMSNAFETTIEYPINAQSMIGVVKVDNAQEITGAKTFTQNIKVTAKPKEATDVATVGYVSGLLNAKAPYDVTLDFKVEGKTDGGWVVYSNMEINLDNGKKLKCIHIDNTQPTSANAPVKAVFKAIPATEVINAAPTEQAPTFFDTYQLQDEEYLGTLTYGHILNSQLQDYASYKGPFHTNQYGTTCTIKEATQLRISISELPAAVSKVSLKFDSSWLPKTFKASLSGVGMDVTSNVLTNPSGNTPLELLFDIVKLTGLVTLDTAQTITGAKTFEKLPKSEATPKDDADLITKAYLDKRCPIPKSELTLKGSAQRKSYYLEAWVDYKDLRLTLDSGEHLVPLYLEGEKPQEDRVPARVIYKISDTPYTKDSIQLKDKAFFDAYVLKEKEILGHVVWPHLLNANMSTNIAQYQAKPFDYMLAGSYPVSYDLKPLIKFTFENLKIGLSKVSILHESSSLETFQIEWTHDNHHFVSKLYTSGTAPFIYGSTLEINIDGALSNFVTLNTQQELTALKTFKVLPQSEAAPADDKDLVNKKYVDEKVGAGTGAAPANMVTTDTAQNITEVKTFDKLPKSSVEPTDDTELVNKKYVDSKAGGGSIKTSLLIKAYPYVVPKPLAVWEAGYQDLKISLEDNKHLVPLYLESTSAKDATAAINVIYKVSDTEYVKGSIQQQAKEWFNTYELKEGEVKGLIYFANVLNDNLLNNAYSTSVDPFDDYAAGGNYDKNGSLIKFLFVDLPLKIRKFSFKLGATSQNSLPQSIQVFGSSGSERYTSALLESSIDDFYVGQKRTFHISFVNEEYVGLRNDQVISGKKVFEVTPELKTPPVGSNEVATKGYVDGLLNVPQQCVVRIKAKNVAGQKRICMTRPRLYLSNGMVLQATHATEDRRSNSNCAVFKPVPASDKEFPAPEKSTWSLMEQMVKQDKTLVFANIKMGNVSDSSIPIGISYPCARDLFGANGADFDLAGTTSTEVTPVTFEFNKLPAPVTSLGLYSHWNGVHVQRNTSAYKYEVAFGSKSAVSTVVNTNTMEDYKYTTLKAAVANSIIDYTDVKQNITALKTFDVLPQAKATPTDEKDFVTKKFLDAAIAELDRRIKALEAAKI